MLILALLLGACGDPELTRYQRALEVWDEGKALMAQGEPAQAAERFARLAELDPQSATALAWQALALDRAGDEEGALTLLDAALARFPGDAALRYNRAALRARRGEVERAAEDLRILYAGGGADPLDVGQDPDFAAIAADPATASLAPPPSVDVLVRGEEGPVLLGEDASVELQVVSQTGALLSISDLGAPGASLRHTRTVEDLLPSGGKRTARMLTVTYRTLAPGQITLGPWLVAAGGASAVTERLTVDVLALPGRQVRGAPDEAGTVRSVEALFAGHEAPWAGREGQGVLVLLSVGAKAQVRGADGAQDPSPVVLELRRAGQTVAQGELHRLPGAARVEIVRAGQVLLETEIPAAEPLPAPLTPPR